MQKSADKGTSNDGAERAPGALAGMAPFAWGEPGRALGGDEVERMFRCGQIVAEGARGMTQEWLDCAHEAIRRRYAGWRELTESRSLHDVFSNQEKLVRSEAELFAQSAARLTEQWTGTARDAAALFAKSNASA